MATETITIPYSHSIFHEAFDIYQASSEFLKRDGRNFVDEILAPIIKKHGMEEAFGSTLVHRHFDIAPDEKLVEFNNITTPWTINVGLNEFNGRTDSLVYETAWMLNPEGKWMAYEHAFSPIRGRDSYIVDIQDPKRRDFLKEYTAALEAGGWAKLLGLRAWPGKGFEGTFEFTQGKANINLVPGQFDMEREEGIIYNETMWFWADEFRKRSGRCYCQQGRHGGHVGHTNGPGSGGPKGPNGDVLGYAAARK